MLITMSLRRSAMRLALCWYSVGSIVLLTSGLCGIQVCANSGKDLEKEAEVTKSIVLYQMVDPTDNIFERQMKSLVSNFLVNTAISLNQAQPEDTDDYDEPIRATEKSQEKWPSYFGDKSTFSQVVGNRTTTTPSPDKKVFTWPSFYFTSTEKPTLPTTTTSPAEVFPQGEVDQPGIPFGQNQDNSMNYFINEQNQNLVGSPGHQYNPSGQDRLRPEYESVPPPPYNPQPSYPNANSNGNAPYQNNFENPVVSNFGLQNGNQQFNGQTNYIDQSGHRQQLHSQQQSPQSLNQYQPAENQFVSNNQFPSNQNRIQNLNNQMYNPNGIQQNPNPNGFPNNPNNPNGLLNNLNSPYTETIQNSYVNGYQPNFNNGVQQYQQPNFASPNQNQNPVYPQQTFNSPQTGQQQSTGDYNVLVWPDSFMSSPAIETTTVPPLLPNVPGRPIFTSTSTKPPKKVFTWPAYFFQSTEPVPTRPWSLPEAPFYETPSPDAIYSPPKKVSAWSQFPSMPLTTSRPFRHRVSTLRTISTSSNSNSAPSKVFTFPSFYFTSTSTAKSVVIQSMNSTSPMLITNSTNSNDTLQRQDISGALPSLAPQPQKSVPRPPSNSSSGAMTTPLTSPLVSTNQPKEIHPTAPSSTFANISVAVTSTAATTAKPVKTTQKPKPARKPAGLIGAIQYFTLIVPDALRPGRNTTSLLNKQSVNSILKIIGSVAFLNLSGVIDNSVALGTSDPVRELVSGVSGLVLCNPVIRQLNGGRCGRGLQILEHKLTY